MFGKLSVNSSISSPPYTEVSTCTIYPYFVRENGLLNHVRRTLEFVREIVNLIHRKKNHNVHHPASVEKKPSSLRRKIAGSRGQLYVFPAETTFNTSGSLLAYINEIVFAAASRRRLQHEDSFHPTARWRVLHPFQFWLQTKLYQNTGNFKNKSIFPHQYYWIEAGKRKCQSHHQRRGRLRAMDAIKRNGRRWKASMKVGSKDRKKDQNIRFVCLA